MRSTALIVMFFSGVPPDTAEYRINGTCEEHVLGHEQDKKKPACTGPVWEGDALEQGVLARGVRVALTYAAPNVRLKPS